MDYLDIPIAGFPEREEVRFLWLPAHFALLYRGETVVTWPMRDWLSGRMCLLRPKGAKPLEYVRRMETVHEHALQIVIMALSRQNMYELAAGILLEHGRQIGLGLPVLPNGPELAKRYLPDGSVLYLFNDRDTCVSFAREHEPQAPIL